MSIEASAAPEAAAPTGLVVFGRDEGGKPHASRFGPADAALAEKAAGLMGMSALRIVSVEDHALAAELPAGRVFGSGRAFVPFIKAGLFARLEGVGAAFRPEPPAATPAKAAGRAKGGRRAAAAGEVADTGSEAAGEAPAADWQAITRGSLVLACAGPMEGWFEAVVVTERPHDLFELRWRDWPEDPLIVRRRDALGLLPAGEVRS